ncbi:MAG: lysylphosphatidylglycerol synthase transmembrane domain-containing protein [Dehalococcoidia bacterium]
MVVSAVLLFLFLYRTDFAEMGRALKEAQYVFLIPGVLIYFCGVYFRAVRWKFFLKPFGNFSSFRLFPLVVIGFLVNIVLPGRLGIIARAYILGEKENISKMSVGGTMVAEQVFDGIILLVFALSISIVAPLSGKIEQAVDIAAGLFSVALLLCLMLVFSERFRNKAINLLLLILPKRWRSTVKIWLLHVIDGLKFMRSPKQLLVTLALSVLVWLSEAGLFYMVALSFDLGQPFYIILLVTSVASLSWALIFVAPGGVGPFDYFCKATMMLFIPAGVVSSVYEASVSAYVIVLHAVILFPVIALGFVFLWKENFSLAKVKLIGRNRQ